MGCAACGGRHKTIELYYSRDGGMFFVHCPRIGQKLTFSLDELSDEGEPEDFGGEGVA